MALVPFARLCVTQFHYAMDGEYTCDIFLTQDSLRHVSWTSMRTGLSTPWHGHWYIGPGNDIIMEFDFRGRMGTRKWAQVSLTTMEGMDYLQRHIVIKCEKSWNFDPATNAKRAQAESKGRKTYAQPQSVVCQRLLAAYFLGNIPTVHAAQFTIEVSTMDMITIALASLFVVGVTIWRGWKN